MCKELHHNNAKSKRLALNAIRTARGCVWLLSLAACLLVLHTGAALAQLQEADPPDEAAPLDLLEGIEEPPPEEKPPAEPEEPPAEPLSTVEEIAEQMQRVESRLRDADAGQDTQAMQEDIIAALDAFIEEMQKSGGGQPSNSQPSAGQPSGQATEDTPSEQQDSQQQEGEGDSSNEENEDQQQQGEERERDPEEAIDESIERAGHEPGEGPQFEDSRPNLLREAWGHLPGHAAEAMPNAATEQFLPRYQREIESYFRRLNEEQPSDSL